MNSDTDLDPDAGLFERTRLFSVREILTYVFVGAALLITVFATMMWADDGFLVDEWAWGRVVTALASILFGLGLGWMLYPRRVPGLSDDA